MKRLIAVLTLALCAAAVAQERAPAGPRPADDDSLMAMAAPEAAPLPEPGPQGPDGPRQRFKRPGFGGDDGQRMKTPMKFWNDSEIASKINLTDQQKQQLETTFTNYRLKLIDQRAAVQREQVKLEPLVQADKLDESAITKQIDSLISARMQLEKTVAMMGVDIRKVLTTEQWKQLKDMRHGMMGMGPMGDPGDGPRGRMRERRPGPGGDGQTPPPQPQQ